MLKCDLETGVCQLPDDNAAPLGKAAAADKATVHYVGDPMCSWCWGISPAIGEIAGYCAENGIAFDITMGGLRAGGGDEWNASFKAFLRNEWRHIAQVTGQPFGFSLLDLPDFHYDTEPACRAVACAEILAPEKTLNFMGLVQRKFYVDGEDPKQGGFYQSICQALQIDFAEFHTLFMSERAKQAVKRHFDRCRAWQVRGFPSILLEKDGKTEPLAVGFTTAEKVINRLKN